VEFRHVSVLAEEALAYLAPHPGGIYVDGTLGGAGHAERILEESGPDGRLYGFDRDEEALTAARERLSRFGDRVHLFHENFDSMRERLSAEGIERIDGFLLDLGVSSHQLDRRERGFSFMEDAPLDMRMDRSSGTTAAEILESASEGELEKILREYGEERWARRIARVIVRERLTAPILTTLQLADLVRGAIPRAKQEERIHPATRTFQGLRIAVNDELGSLERGIAAGLELLGPGGRGAAISFHSLEDRIVKNAFRDAARGCICPREIVLCRCGNLPKVKVLTPKGVKASENEVAGNPRSRSARLRAVEKL
jgi:16S rRNA (cytosine1402-N4)-methyltransferase